MHEGSLLPEAWTSGATNGPVAPMLP